MWQLHLVATVQSQRAVRDVAWSPFDPYQAAFLCQGGSLHTLQVAEHPDAAGRLHVQVSVNTMITNLSQISISRSPYSIPTESTKEQNTWSLCHAEYAPTLTCAQGHMRPTPCPPCLSHSLPSPLWLLHLSQSLEEMFDTSGSHSGARGACSPECRGQQQRRDELPMDSPSQAGMHSWQESGAVPAGGARQGRQGCAAAQPP